MNSSSLRLRRLVLGMSLEDAQSKFDSPQSRTLLRVAHERHNQGILHELQLAQHQRNKMPSEKKCHISRYTKPSVKGFQGYLKETPDDYVVVELWEPPKEVNREGLTSKDVGTDNIEAVRMDDDDTDLGGEASLVNVGEETSALSQTQSGTSEGTTKIPAVIGDKIAAEKTAFSRSKETVLETLRDALDNVKNNVLVELTERRQGGALIAGNQPSVVERLVGEVSESGDRGYKTLSSSSHLLEPVEMEVTLYSKRDKEIADAFTNPLLAFPAREGDISFSLWVAGGLIADDETASEFPFHIAKYVVVHGADNSSPTRLPRADVEVYFSPELYQLQHTIGKPGIVALRKFIGNVMMRQHEPTPTSSTLLLNAFGSDKDLLNMYDPSKSEAVRIPWVRRTRSTVSTITGVAFNVEDAVEDSATIEKMKEGVGYVWRAWGHLIKDLHVHGDLDYLYVSIDRKKEFRENTQYISEVQRTEASSKRPHNSGSNQLQLASSESTGNALVAQSHTEPGSLARRRGVAAKQKTSVFYPIPADFTVIECFLERKGLPHNMVIEDITETLTDMQTQSLEMMRLSVFEEVEQEGEGFGASVVPLLYAPKIAVTHAGVIENRTHSFQRIRIRGSTLAHVEALIQAMNDGDYFTTRSENGPAGSLRTPSGSTSSSSPLLLPDNLTFSATHAPQTALLLRESARTQGHLASAASDMNVGPQRSVGGGGRFRRHQTQQALEFMSVSDEERLFWKENYYKLSEPKVVFQDRVDPSDLGLGPGATPGKPAQPSPRLLEHLSIVGTKLTDDGEALGTKEAGKGKRGKKRATKKKSVNVTTIPHEKMFEYLCTDMEAETAQYDLRVGDCLGYAYKVNVRKIPSKQAPRVGPAVQSVVSKGFINYFGPNRFASYTKMNMHPGLHLLKGEFRAAAHVVVQQFYIDAAMEAEKQRTGAAFPQPLGLNGTGGGLHLKDFAQRGGRRSVAQHGTAMQRVLSNALQASMLMAGIDGDADTALDGATDLSTSSAATSVARGTSYNHGQLTTFTEMIDADPCADAFLNVIGPNACHILIHEFLAFVWNDIVNQRLQRYGTFAILPGDLVRKHPSAPRGSKAYGELTRVTRREIQSGQRTHWDVVLPIPGANMELPENHTADLYIVTLKRLGLLFNAEARQWECFYPRLWEPSPSSASESGHGNVAGGPFPLAPSSLVGRGHAAGGVPLSSPYRSLSSSYQLIEEELGFQTPFTEPLPRHVSSSSSSSSSSSTGKGNASRADGGAGVRQGQEAPQGEILFDPDMDSLTSALTGSGRVGSPSLFDARGLRPDLQRQAGNPLNLMVEAGYRHPLFRPGEHLRWELNRGAIEDPHHRWALQRSRTATPRRAATGATPLPAGLAGTSARELRRMAALPVGTYIPGGADANSPATLVLPAPSAASLSGPTASVARLPRPALLASAPIAPSRWRDRRLPIPKRPYWLPEHNDGCLTLDFQLPAGVYASMLLRELTKLDVNSPEVVDLERPSAAGSATLMSPEQQAQYRAFMERRRRRAFATERPQAVSLALLHQQIFRSGGIRGSLIPTLRSYDSVSK